MREKVNLKRGKHACLHLKDLLIKKILGIISEYKMNQFGKDKF